MLLSIAVVFIVLTDGFVTGSYFSSNDKICDASLGASFSGFKIQRSYVVKDFKPPMLHFVSLTHCKEGKMVYERLTRTGRETDIDWDSPICLMTTDKIRENSKYKKEERKERFNDIKRYKNWNDILKKFHSYRPTLSTLETKSSHKKTLLEFLKKMSSHLSFIEYHEDPLTKNLEDLNTYTYENVTVGDLDNLKCYKLARRKKYAKRKMMLYAPYTWVGGIFECNVGEKDKRKYLESLKDSSGFISSFKVECTKENSKPLFPLIADDITGQWIEKKRGFTVSQRIPYLYSPGAFDFRYGKTAQKLGLKSGGVIYQDHVNKDSKDRLPFDSWYKELNVNENYDYTENDISKISNTVTQSSNIFNQFLRINAKYLPWEWDKTEFIGYDKSAISYLEHKVSTVFSKLANRSSALDVITKVQREWDELTL